MYINEIIFLIRFYSFVASFNYVACQPAGRYWLWGKRPGGRKIQNFTVLNYRSLQKESGLYCRRSKATNL
jgi:hypothetical protein